MAVSAPQPLGRLSRLSDLLPSPSLRKTLRKLMGDQAAHIEELRRQGRLPAARWIAFSTWGLWLWYVLKSPVTSLVSAVKKVAH